MSEKIKTAPLVLSEHFTGTLTDLNYKEAIKAMHAYAQQFKSSPNQQNEVWIKATQDLRAYPIGTKAKALGGGHWIKNERGWKWCTGATFPNVGGDWTGEVCLPSYSSPNQLEK